MQRLEKKLENIGVELCLVDMEGPGYYLPELKKMFINQSLMEDEIKLTVLHELKHALDHEDFSELYKSFVYRLKMEREANDYMLNEMLKEHEGDFNYTTVIENLKIGMGNEMFHLNLNKEMGK